MDEAVNATEDCLGDISTWMENNLLKLNQNKTELIVFSSKQSIHKTSIFHLSKRRNSLMLFEKPATNRYAV